MAVTPTPEPDDQTTVALNVRSLMGRYQVTQKRLANEIGVSRPTLTSRLNGETSFTIRELSKIARFFGKSLGDVVSPMFLMLATPIILGTEGSQLELPFDSEPPVLEVVLGEAVGL